MAIYRDLNLFNPQEKALVEDIEAIHQSLQILFNTKLNEIVFRDLGSDLEDGLFEFIDEISTNVLYKVIVDAIEQYEPRVELDLNRTDIIPLPDKSAFEINLYFTVIGFDQNQKFEFTGILNNNRG